MQNKLLGLVYYPTDVQLDDIFTKALSREKFEKFRELLGVRDNELNIMGGC